MSMDGMEWMFFLPVQCRRTCHRLRWMSIDKRRVVCLDSVDATPCGTSHRHCRDKFDCTLWMRRSRREKYVSVVSTCNIALGLITWLNYFPIYYAMLSQREHRTMDMDLKINELYDWKSISSCWNVRGEEVKSLVRQTWLTIESYVPRQQGKWSFSQ